MAGLVISVTAVAAYAATTAAVLAAALWGHGVAEDGQDARKSGALGVVVGLATVQALLWAHVGAGIGGAQ